MSSVTYRKTLPVVSALFGAAAVAATIVFIVYTAEWADNSANATFSNRDETNRYVRAQYGYQATVIALLMLIVFFNGYHLNKK